MEKMWSDRNPHSLLVGMGNSMPTWENVQFLMILNRVIQQPGSFVFYQIS